MMEAASKPADSHKIAGILTGLSALFAAILLIFPGTSWSAGCTLPLDVSTRVGRAQTFGYKIPDLQVLSGTRDFLWQGDTGRGAVPSSVFSSFYVTGDRAPYMGSHASKRLAWYQANHPDWIVYRPDQKTPAWEFCLELDPAPGGVCDGRGDVPLAIWNTSVQTWMLDGDVQTGISAGIYQGISADNVGPTNAFYKSGTCSVVPDSVGCTHAGGVWTPRYNSAGSTSTGARSGATAVPVADTRDFGAILGNAGGVRIVFRKNGPVLYAGTLIAVSRDVLRVSPPLSVDIPSGATAEAVSVVSKALTNDWVNWLMALKSKVNAANMCLTANVSWNSYNRMNWAAVASVPDMIYDEQGFAGSGSAADCSPGGGTTYKFYDRVWIDKATDMAAIRVAKILEAGVCTDPSNSKSKTEYTVATYLLVKDSHSYQELFYHEMAGFEDFSPLLYLEHGLASGDMAVTNGIYHRAFANALALVNPSSSEERAYNLGTSAYYGTNCRRYVGKVALPPITGMVLMTDQPSACSQATKP